jgi:hypothetical protein
MNNQTFKGVELSFILIKYLFLRTLFDWMYAFGSVHSMSFVEFIHLLNLLYFLCT